MNGERAINRPFGISLRRPGVLVGMLVLAGGMVWGCAGQAAAMADATSQATRAAGSTGGASQAATAIDAFGFDLYRAALTPGSNGVFSPASIVLALSMAQAGARGETATQMDKVLHAALGSGDGNGINSLDQALDAISGDYTMPDGTKQKVTLRIANAPFAQIGEKWEQAYLDTLAARYGADLKLVDYKADPAVARDQINGWISDQTEGRIPKLIDSLDSRTRLVLANAIYLKAPWLTHFDATGTVDAPFTRADGSQVKVPTMSVGLSEGRYASGSGWQAVDIPYVNTSLAMTIVVPDDLATFEKSLDSAQFSQITSALADAQVDLTLPKFKIETSSDLSSILPGMGMPLAFDAAKADFSGMTTQEPLFISKVLHQANISVDENGTEASAATVVVMAAGSAAPRQVVSMHVDKPFLFAVRDRSTGAILFLGRVADPSA
jgi:serpin B